MDYKEFVRGWHGGLPETPCGAGSRWRNTAQQRAWIPEMVRKYEITSIADLGAGDLNWASRTEFGCDYTAYDLVPRHDSVIKLDILTDELPAADCYLCLWVINHMTPEQALFASQKILSSKARYLFATYRKDYYNFIDATVLETIKVSHGAEMHLIEL